jgi:hypothetical protein
MMPDFRIVNALKPPLSAMRVAILEIAARSASTELRRLVAAFGEMAFNFSHENASE